MEMETPGCLIIATMVPDTPAALWGTMLDLQVVVSELKHAHLFPRQVIRLFFIIIHLIPQIADIYTFK